MKIAMVTWLDSGAHIDLGWASADDFAKHDLSRQVVTVGFLMQETEDVLSLAQTYDDSADTYLSAQLIYKPTIVSIVYLEGPS